MSRVRFLVDRAGQLPPWLTAFAKGSLWLALAAAAGQGSMLVANIIVANLVGVADFGRFSLLQQSISTSAIIAQLSFGVVVSRQTALLRDNDPRSAGAFISFSFVMASILSLLLVSLALAYRQSIADDIFRDPVLAGGILIAAFGIPFLALAFVQQGVFGGLENFHQQARLSFWLSPAVVLLPAVGAWTGGIAGALLGLVAVHLLRAVANQAVLRGVMRDAGIGWVWGPLRDQLGVVGRLALPATIAGVVSALAIWGGQTLLARQPGGIAVLGLFSAAFAIKTVILFLPTQMVSVLLPMLSRADGPFGAQSRRRLLLANVAASGALTLVLACVCALFAPSIMSIFGAGFSDGAPVLRILMIAAPVEALSITLYQKLQSTGRYWLSATAVNIPMALTVVAGALLLVPEHLAEGLAFAWLAGWIVAFVAICLATKPWRPLPEQAGN